MLIKEATVHIFGRLRPQRQRRLPFFQSLGTQFGQGKPNRCRTCVSHPVPIDEYPFDRNMERGRQLFTNASAGLVRDDPICLCQIMSLARSSGDPVRK